MNSKKKQISKSMSLHSARALCLMLCLGISLFSLPGCAKRRDNSETSAIPSTPHTIKLYHIADQGGEKLWDESLAVSFSGLTSREWIIFNGYNDEKQSPTRSTLELGYKRRASFRYHSVYVGFDRLEENRYLMHANEFERESRCVSNGQRWLWVNLNEIPNSQLHKIRVVTLWLDMDQLDETHKKALLIFRQYENDKSIEAKEAAFLKSNRSKILENWGYDSSVQETIDSVIEKFNN